MPFSPTRVTAWSVLIRFVLQRRLTISVSVNIVVFYIDEDIANSFFEAWELLDIHDSRVSIHVL